MSTTAPSLSTALTDILNAVVTIIDETAQTISANASVIGTVVVVGAVLALVVKFGGQAFRGISGFFRGFA